MAYIRAKSLKQIIVLSWQDE